VRALILRRLERSEMFAVVVRRTLCGAGDTAWMGDFRVNQLGLGPTAEGGCPT
jgi:hypothetical protein